MVWPSLVRSSTAFLGLGRFTPAAISQPRPCIASPLTLSLRRALSMASQSNDVVLDADSKHSATVIFLHGLGDTGMGWADAMEMVQQKGNQHIKFVLPTAPIRPVSLNMGMKMPAWYDIGGLHGRISEDAEGMQQSFTTVSRLIEKEIQSGIPASRIMLGGFSQGGAMSLYSILRLKHKLAGVIGLSCYMPLLSQAENVVKEGTHTPNIHTPVFMCHGDADTVVSLDWGRDAAKLLQRSGFSAVEFKVYSDLAHSLDMDELQDVQQFISKNLSPLSKI